jgi:hypothetical protein
MDSVLIYNNLNSKNKIKKNVLLVDNDNISNLYNCRIVNPPFFKKIFIIDDTLIEDHLKKIYNMCLVNGKIYFIDKYTYFFNNNKILNKKNDKYKCFFPNINYKIFTKEDNNIYTFHNKRIIDFIIMGVQRGGTTSLAQNLSQHNDIFLNKNIDPKISEVHYYDINWKKGINWYKQQFNYKYKLVGEKTPDLINLEYTFPLIQSVNPYVKLILVLRNPIDRAYSAWKLNVKYFEEKKTFEEAVFNELNQKENTNKTFYSIIENYLQRGLYFQQIEKLLKWFPRQNVLILISENIKENPFQEYKKIYDFLNLDSLKTQKYEITHVSNDTSKINKKLYNDLIKYYKEDVSKLEKLLNIQLNSIWL